MMDLLDPRSVRGATRLLYVPDGLSAADSPVASPFLSNLVMYDWATIVAQLLRGAPDGRPYKISAVYLEFENDGGADVDPPAYDRSGGRAYYQSLSSHATRDYLRVPLIGSSIDTSNLSLFPGGNVATFFAQTEGTSGVHGKDFSVDEQSRVFGAALVATPDFDDPTEDLVFSRTYYSTPANQLQKLTGSQIGIQWQITLQ